MVVCRVVVPLPPQIGDRAEDAAGAVRRAVPEAHRADRGWVMGTWVRASCERKPLLTRGEPVPQKSPNLQGCSDKPCLCRFRGLRERA